MSLTSFTVFCRPLPMPRPRVTRNGTFSGSAEHRHLKTKIRSAAQLVRVPFHVGPVSMGISFHLPTDCITFWKRGSGDLENMSKLVLDALEGVAYANDAQVCVANLSKAQAEHGQERIEISIAGTPGKPKQPKKVSTSSTTWKAFAKTATYRRQK